VNGGAGKDALGSGLGGTSIRDRIVGGSGNDRITSAGFTLDGSGNQIPDAWGADRVNCGSGTDFVQADSSDSVNANCERVLLVDE
jgi:hypothetical protein